MGRGLVPIPKGTGTGRQEMPRQVVSTGNVTWRRGKGLPHRTSPVLLLPGLVPAEVVDATLSILRADGFPFDVPATLDPIDAMPRRDFYLQAAGVHRADAAAMEETVEKAIEEAPTGSSIDFGPAAVAAARVKRKDARTKISAMFAPVVNRLTVFLRLVWKDLCQTAQAPAGTGGGQGEPQECTPCATAIRRYMPGERRSRVLRRDGLNLVTAVVSLSDYGKVGPGSLAHWPPHAPTLSARASLARACPALSPRTARVRSRHPLRLVP